MSQAATTTIKPALDAQRIRADFPALAQQVSGKPLVYLDSAASTQKPRQVIDTIAGFYENDYANVHRGIHTLSQRATDRFEAARENVRLFINAQSIAQVIFTRGTTESINLVAHSYANAFLNEGDEILVSAMEHHSNIVPWQLLAQQKGMVVKVIPMNENGELIQSEYEKLLNRKVKLVAVNMMSNALGTINPIADMIKSAHAIGAKVVVDAAQGAAHQAIDVQALDCDFLTLSAHKFYGPTGIGVLYGKHELLDAMPPYQGGGEMIKEVSFSGTTFNELPHKFEAGTPNIAGAIGMSAAIDYVCDIGLDAISAYENEVLQYATQQLLTIDGLKIIGNATNKASILSFHLDGIHASDLGTLLDHQGVAVRVGHHCAMPVMAFFGVSATTRASLAVYNNQADIDALVTAIKTAINMLR